MTKENQNKPKAIYEPGELERTRKNLGEISQEEAIKLTKDINPKIGVPNHYGMFESNTEDPKKYTSKIENSFR